MTEKTKLLMNFIVDREKNQVRVEREFAAPLALVWQAWTDSKILDEWWAPKPWKTNTKSQEFKDGGRWLYSMNGPEGEVHWCLAEYSEIVPQKSYRGLDAFCDEEGNINPEFPRSQWHVVFEGKGDHTIVHSTTQYEKLEDLEMVVKMGMQEGFTMALENLDAYFETH